MTHSDSSFSLETVTPVPCILSLALDLASELPVVPRGPRLAPQPADSFPPQEDTAMALQRLVELTASRVMSVKSLRVQYRLIRKLGSGSYGRVLLAQLRQGGEFNHQGMDFKLSHHETSQRKARPGGNSESAELCDLLRDIGPPERADGRLQVSHHTTRQENNLNWNSCHYHVPLSYRKWRTRDGKSVIQGNTAGQGRMGKHIREDLFQSILHR